MTIPPPGIFQSYILHGNIKTLARKEDVYYRFWTYWNQRNPFFHFQVSEKNEFQQIY